MRLIVVEREQIAQRVVRLTLGDESGARLPAWMPGAHIDLTGPTGIVHQYSLCGELADPWHWRLAVLHEPDGRGGSIAIHDSIRVGGAVMVDGPRNQFRLTDSPRFLFIAGGIGITPIVPMVELLSNQDELVNERPWRLMYTGNHRATMAFADQLEHHGPLVTLHESAKHGRLDLGATLGEITQPTAVFCCGPGSLIEDAQSICASSPVLEFHGERFTPTIDLATAASGAAFTVELARRGQSITVDDGVTIIDALERAGIDAPCSCREGVCGTCETRVIAGTPDHRDSVLDNKERDRGETMMICVSRAANDKLVLDL